MVGFWWFLLLLNECPFFSPDLLILFLVLLGLSCCTSFSLVAVCGLLVVALTVKQGSGAAAAVAPGPSGTASVVAVPGLVALWDPSRLAVEPVSPVLTGGSFTTEPPGKPQVSFFGRWILYH